MMGMVIAIRMESALGAASREWPAAKMPLVWFLVRRWSPGMARSTMTFGWVRMALDWSR
jgi:hypothetical protein